VVASATPDANDESTTAPGARDWAWADLMRRAFDVDVLACPRWGDACAWLPRSKRSARRRSGH